MTAGRIHDARATHLALHQVGVHPADLHVAPELGCGLVPSVVWPQPPASGVCNLVCHAPKLVGLPTRLYVRVGPWHLSSFGLASLWQVAARVS